MSTPRVTCPVSGSSSIFLYVTFIFYSPRYNFIKQLSVTCVHWLGTRFSLLTFFLFHYYSHPYRRFVFISVVSMSGPPSVCLERQTYLVANTGNVHAR